MDIFLNRTISALKEHTLICLFSSRADAYIGISKNLQSKYYDMIIWLKGPITKMNQSDLCFIAKIKHFPRILQGLFDLLVAGFVIFSFLLKEVTYIKR